jgi:uncharacterized membrane protein YgaE (UPF0421/DUF939 family)
MKAKHWAAIIAMVAIVGLLIYQNSQPGEPEVRTETTVVDNSETLSDILEEMKSLRTDVSKFEIGDPYHQATQQCWAELRIFQYFVQEARDAKTNERRQAMMSAIESQAQRCNDAFRKREESIGASDFPKSLFESETMDLPNTSIDQGSKLESESDGEG